MEMLQWIYWCIYVWTKNKKNDIKSICAQLNKTFIEEIT